MEPHSETSRARAQRPKSRKAVRSLTLNELEAESPMGFPGKDIAAMLRMHGHQKQLVLPE